MYQFQTCYTEKEKVRMDKNDQLSDSYPKNDSYMEKYVEYQKKYANRIRESDKVIIRLIGSKYNPSDSFSLLDIGCSTGNLLRHIKTSFPYSNLTGGDLSEKQIEVCTGDNNLKDINFAVLDVTNIEPDLEFDIVVANAIFMGLTDDKVGRAASSIYRVLKPGGILILFDFLHPWNQELQIIERSQYLPSGYLFHYRSFGRVADLLGENQLFKNFQFIPFEIPIDLEVPEFGSPNLQTYTVNSASGNRIQFRGVLSQPWCHMVAEKK